MGDSTINTEDIRKAVDELGGQTKNHELMVQQLGNITRALSRVIEIDYKVEKIMKKVGEIRGLHGSQTPGGDFESHERSLRGYREQLTKLEQEKEQLLEGIEEEEKKEYKKIKVDLKEHRKTVQELLDQLAKLEMTYKYSA